MRRVCFIAAILVGVSVARAADDLVGVGPATTASSRSSAGPSTRAARRNPPNVVDRLVHIDSADGWSSSVTENINVLPDVPPRIVMGYKESEFPRIGKWTGEEVKTKFDFTNLIASFNPHTPPNTGVMLEVRVQTIDEKWSPWLFMQAWGRTLTPPERVIKFDGGAIDIDELELSKPAQAYQTRLTLYSFDFDVRVVPSIRRLSVCYSGVVDDPKQHEKLSPTTHPSNWARDLAVPFRGQGDFKNPKSLWGLICSPTSTSMVLEYYGVNFTTVENALPIYDPQYDMFGNWGRAVARAGELGFDAWLDRFRNWEQVKVHIAAGHPVIASIRFKKGEVKGFLYEFTKGHLLVIRGFTPNGDVIVNDPASREKGKGAVYPPAEFAKAWFDNGGVGYVIQPPSGGLPPNVAKSPTTSPATKPVETSHL